MSLIKGNHAGLGGAGAPGGGLGTFFSHTIGQSVRFSDNHHLDRTATAGNQSTWTFSAWIKRAELGTTQYIWTPYVGGDTSNESAFRFTTDDKINIYDSGASRGQVTTTAVFRDVSAWLHLVVVLDLTESTATDRLKIYVNGTLQAITTNNAIGTSVWGWNANSIVHRLGGYARNTTSNLVGYMAEVNFVDGTALTPSTFGETKDGVWIPKKVSGVTYGTNGFHVDFADSSDIGNNANSTDGTNDFTTVTNLAASDGAVVPDSPTRNFATLNSLMVGGANTQVHASAVYSEGNLKVACGGYSTSTIGGGFSTIAIPKDKKIYVEVCETNSTEFGAGVLIQDHVQNNTQISGNGSVAYYNRSVIINGTETDYGSSAGAGGLGVARLAAGDVLGIAIDGATGKVWFHRNGTYFKSPSTNNSGTTGNPSAGTNEIGTVTNTTAINPSGNLFFFLTGNSSTDNLFINFGQDSTFAGNKSAGSETDANGEGLFQYAVPTDYVCLHSGNMSDITIGPGQSSQADDYFNTVLYTGNGSDGRSITGVGFDPDFVWIKSRNLTTSNLLNDTLRGANKSLFSEATTAETADNGGGYLSAFVTDGFSVTSGSSGDDAVNDGSDTYVAWNWNAGGAPTADNSAGNGATPTAGSVKIDGSNLGSALAGSLAATRLSANTTAGFSIVAWDASGVSTGTMAHGLTAAPDIIIAKNRNHGTNWFVQVPDILANTNILNLETTAANFNPGINHFNDTVPTATVFSFGGYLGGHSDVGSNTQMIAYCFHSVEGFSAINSFIGNGNNSGPFVYTGFRPAFVLLKVSSTTNNWFIYDNKREGYNQDNDTLSPNLTAVEDNSYKLDLLSNGFKIRGSQNAHNQSGQTFIYLAFAEAPFKFANAR